MLNGRKEFSVTLECGHTRKCLTRSFTGPGYHCIECKQVKKPVSFNPPKEKE